MQTYIPLKNSVLIKNTDDQGSAPHSGTIILQELLIEDELDLYPDKELQEVTSMLEELQEATSMLEELQELFSSLGFVVQSDGPKLELIKRKSEIAKQDIKEGTQVIANLPPTFFQRKSNELRFLLLASGLVAGTAIGGPLGLALSAKASIGLGSALIGAATGASLGWTVSEAMKFWKKP